MSERVKTALDSVIAERHRARSGAVGRRSPWLVAVLVVAGLLTPSMGAAASPHADSSAADEVPPPAIADLEVEQRDRPLGLDVARPRLSWTLSSDARGVSQRAYRVLVATSETLLEPGRADVWDSGLVGSDRTAVLWDGPQLEPATRYHWRVQSFLDRGDEGAWSEASWFETGLLDQGGWDGSDWIGAPPPTDTGGDGLAGSDWIWHADGDPPNAPAGERYLRRAFEVPASPAVVAAELVLTADDGYTAWLNGEEVGRSADGAEAWREARRHALPVEPGTNVVAVSAFNRAFAGGGDSPAGVLGYVELTYADGTAERLATDTSWRTSEVADAGWRTAGFDDAGWGEAVVHAPYGEGPWGEGVEIVAAPRRAPLLRTEFDLDAPVERARLYVAAGGYARVTVNGQPSGDHVLSPATTDYDARVQYVTDDVTDLLDEGANAIGAELGRGFFGMTTRTSWNWEDAPWHGEPRLRALLVVDHPDGSTTRIGTGDAWTTASGPTVSDSLYEGDVYDARLTQPGYDRPGFDDGAWVDAAQLPGPDGALEGRRQQPIRVTETLQATRVTSPEPGVHIFHFPRQVAGWPRLHVDGPAGAEVRLRSSERLADDGSLALSTGFTGGDFQTDRYRLAGDDGVETWEPAFSYKGFQYVEVTGWPGEPPAIGDVEARVVHNDLERTGSFSSDNDLFDAIHAATVNTVRNNLHDLPTDTPKYEKNGWTGDAQLGAELFLRNLDTEALLTKWLDDVSDSRWDDGSPALIAPNPDWTWADRSPTWHAAYVMIPWFLYEHSGDTTILTRHYEGIAGYLDLELGRADDGISTTELGDYLPPDAVGNPPEDMRVAATAYVHLMARTTADMAEVLGHDEDAARYRAAAEGVRAAFNREFLDTEAQHYRGTGDQGFRQTHQVLALAFGLVPQDLEDAVVAALVADIEARGDHLWTGVLGTKYLLPVLTEHGHGELAYRVATQTDFPSWGRWFEEGATSLWEHWSDYRSRNHYFLGTIDDWFYGDVAGLRATAPGYRQLRIAPQVLGDLRDAAAEVRTPSGLASVAWSLDAADELELETVIPVGSTAEVHVPAGSRWAVTEGGVPAEVADGVRFARMEDDAAVFVVGSGRYAFATDALLGDLGTLRDLARQLQEHVDSLATEGELGTGDARYLRGRVGALHEHADAGYAARITGDDARVSRAIQRTLTTLDQLDRWLAVHRDRLEPGVAEDLATLLATAREQAHELDARLLGVTSELTFGTTEVAAGDTVRLDARVTNASTERLTGLELDLDLPDGWEATPAGTAAVPDTLGPGEETTVPFDVTVAADHAPATGVAIAGQLTYRHRGSIVTRPLQALVDVVAPLRFGEVTAQPDRITEPEQPVTVHATVLNDSGAPVAGVAVVEAPAGWTVDEAELPVELEPGGDTELVFDLVSGPEVAGGDVTVRVSYSGHTADEARVKIPAALRSWGFETPGDAEGWTPIHQLTPFVVEDGALRTTSTGGDPHMGFSGELGVPLDTGLVVEVVMTSSVDSHGAIFWGTDRAPGFAADRQERFRVEGGAPGTYRVTIPAQSGVLTHLRLDPLETSGQIAVHEIRLLR